MVNFWIISDHHFWHRNIIKYCNRPFYSVRTMNGFMIRQWNKVVKREDIVFHLGDFAFKGKAREIRKKLHGTIILIRGNHDRYLTEDDGFIIVDGTLKLGRYILSHRPLELAEIPEGCINLHGHIHDKPSYNGINISVERLNYQPMELKDEIVIF